MRDHDLKVIETMSLYGGSFVKALSKAALYADDNNLAIIKGAFAEIWKRYELILERNERRFNESI